MKNIKNIIKRTLLSDFAIHMYIWAICMIVDCLVFGVSDINESGNRLLLILILSAVLDLKKTNKENS